MMGLSRTFLRILNIFATTFVVGSVQAAMTTTPGISYSGRIMKADGITPVISSGVTFSVAIYDINKQCLLFTETRTLDLSASGGAFSFDIGDGSGTATFKGNTTDLTGLFNNSKTFSGLTCAVPPSATGFTALAPTEPRLMMVSFDAGDGNGPQTLPALKINPVPSALQAYNLNGYGTGDLLRIDLAVDKSTNANTDLSQTQYDEFWRLVKNPSTAYLTAASAGALGGDVTGTIATNSVVKIRGVAVSATAPTAGQVLTLVGSTWTPTTPGASGVSSIVGTLPISVSGAATSTISIAQADATHDGYLTQANWTTFNNKLSSALASGLMWVGNAGGAATAVSMSGDASMTNAGVVSLSTTGVVAGSYNKVAVDAKGRVTAGQSMTASDVTTALGYTPSSGAGTGFVNGGNTFAGASSLGNINNNNLDFITNNTAKMTIDNNGNVGIGTTAPQNQLSLGRPDSGFPTYAHTSGNVQGLINFYKDPSQGHRNFLDIVSEGDPGNAAGGTIRFINEVEPGSVMSETMRIDQNGFVGIGTAVPLHPLEISTSGSDPLGLVSTQTTSYNRIMFKDPTYLDKAFVGWGNSAVAANYANRMVVGTPGPYPMSIFTNDLPRISVLSTGEVGIGTSTPTAQLEVKSNSAVAPNYVLSVESTNTNGSGADTNALIRFGQNNGSNNQDWRMGTGSTTLFGYTDSFGIRTATYGWNALLIDPSGSGMMALMPTQGYVGIGTTNPGAKLEVAGQIKITGGTPGLNKVLTSDATGLATWATAAASGIPTSLSAANIYVGNSGGAATAVAVSGDATMSSSGAITVDKTTTAANNKILSLDGTGVANVKGVSIQTGAGSVALQSNATTTNYALTFPAAAPLSNGQVMAALTTGVMSWITPLTSSTMTASDVTTALGYTPSSGAGTGFVNGGNTFGGNSSLGNIGNDNLTFLTNNTAKMTILKTGEVGIGTPTPGYTLHALSAGATTALFSSTGTTAGIGFAPSSATTPNGNLSMSGTDFIFDVGGTTITRFNTSTVTFSQNDISAKKLTLSNSIVDPNALLIEGDSSSSRIISVSRNTTGSAGSSLAVMGGGARAAVSNAKGGSLILSSGISTGTGSSGIQFQTATAGATGSTDNTPSTKMVVSQNGNVGIGTAAPLSVLDVVSTTAVLPRGIMSSQYSTDTSGASIIGAKSRGTAVAPLAIVNGDMLLNVAALAADGTGQVNPGYFGYVSNGPVTTGSVPSDFFIRTGLASGGSEKLRVMSGGFVGIGTSTPASLLEISKAGGATMKITNPGVHALYLNATATGSDVNGSTILTLSTVGAERARITNVGDVGIGTTIPGYKLDVQGGDINASGSVRAAGLALTSDIRFKRDIEPLDNALEKILNLRGVGYNWRREEFPQKQFNERHQIGVIAQEVEAQFPEVVDTNKDGFKSVNYPALVAPLIEAVKSLYARITGVEILQAKQARAIASKAEQSEIEQLKAKNQKLEQENAAIKARLDKIEKALQKK